MTYNCTSCVYVAWVHNTANWHGVRQLAKWRLSILSVQFRWYISISYYVVIHVMHYVMQYNYIYYRNIFRDSGYITIKNRRLILYNLKIKSKKAMNSMILFYLFNAIIFRNVWTQITISYTVQIYCKLDVEFPKKKKTKLNITL